MNKQVYGVVYRITNKVNGKCYHGQTVNLKERWLHHLRGDSHCHALRHAIKKYGRSNFVFEAVGSASSKKKLNALEKTLVATSMSPLGYNLMEGGGSNGHPSAETRRRMSVAQKKTQNLPEVKARNSAGVKRAWQEASPKTRAAWRAAQKAAQNRPGVRERRSLSMIEVHTRPELEARRRRSISTRWASYSPEEHAARINKQRIAFQSPRYKRLRSRISKEVLSRPEVKAKLIASQKASFTKERRTEISKRTREAWEQPGEREKRGAAIKQAYAKMPQETWERRRLAIQDAHIRIRQLTSQQVMDRFTDPEFRSRWEAGTKKSWTPERKARVSASMKKIWARPGEKKRRKSPSAANKMAWAKPGERERRRQTMIGAKARNAKEKV